MIKFDFTNHTYVCPYCGCNQSYWHSHRSDDNISIHDNFYMEMSTSEQERSVYEIITAKCTNSSCKKVAVIAYDHHNDIQVDILPQHVYRQFPEYIPEQIRKDYEEAAQIIDLSPKAAATLLRRCLQGMIRDFWSVKKKNLNEEIDALNGKVTPTQWNAIDGLRKLGNIGAHMEKDVNLIIDLTPEQAKKLLNLIELLLEKWYITRHDEEELLKAIKATSDQKQAERKKTP